MTPPVMPPSPPEPGPTRVLAWSRVKLLLIIAPLWGLFLSLNSTSTWMTWQLRSLLVVFLAVLMYGLLERRPAQLPPWLARWVLQLLGVIVAVPVGALLAYWVTTGELLFWRNDALRVTGWLQITYMGILFGPWIALAAMLRSVLGKHQLDDMLAEREKLNLDIQQALDAQTDTWGIKVSNVEIKQVDLTESMIRAIARQAEAERERRAKVIHAEGELQAAEKLFQAAKILAQEPQAIQLRYLETLTVIGADKNTTIIFPLPIDLLTPFMERLKQG